MARLAAADHRPQRRRLRPPLPRHRQAPGQPRSAAGRVRLPRAVLRAGNAQPGADAEGARTGPGRRPDPALGRPPRGGAAAQPATAAVRRGGAADGPVPAGGADALASGGPPPAGTDRRSPRRRPRGEPAMTLDDVPKDEDRQSLDLLDAYLSDLHAGRRPDRERILSKRPDLAGLLDCVEALDRLNRGHVDSPTVVLPSPPEPPAFGPLSFAHYEELVELGRGGMGVVYKARQTDLDRVVALKMILSGNLARPDLVERFKAEARLAARLRHPNIVPVHEAGEVGGQHYFAMEFIDGRGLDDVLQAGPRPAAQAVRLIAQVARAVHYLHGEGLIHRDLKPSNILIDREGRPYLTAFGFADLLEGARGLAHSGTGLGTPSYVRPAQAAGGRDVGPLSDVYSLGAILYEALTGRPPFREQTPLETVLRVMEGEPSLPRSFNPKLPREVEAICLKCLRKEPSGRYSSAAALADDLERYLAGEATNAPTPGLGEHLRRWFRREPALVSRLLALALFALVVQINYIFDPQARTDIHVLIMTVVAGWAVLSWGAQRLLSRPGWGDVARYVWPGSEPFLLTALLVLTGTGASPLLITFPLLVAGSGLWFEVGVVWFTAMMAELAFALLVACVPELRVYWHHAVLFAILLGVLSLATAHQVQRIRWLSRITRNPSRAPER